MSDEPARAVSVPDPVPGENFRRATALPIEGTKRRKLLCLLAAYADAGETSPAMRELCRRTGIEDPRVVDGVLRTLIADGYLDVRWAPQGARARGLPEHPRNVYTLRLNRSPGARSRPLGP